MLECLAFHMIWPLQNVTDPTISYFWQIQFLQMNAEGQSEGVINTQFTYAIKQW
jgi:hypothetical protein